MSSSWKIARTAHKAFSSSSQPSSTAGQLLMDSWDRLLATGTPPQTLDILAHRFAAERAMALQRPGKIILFLCGHNAGRSQMAASWFNHKMTSRSRLTGSGTRSFVGLSAGSKPSNRMNPVIIQAMEEVGVSLDGCFPKPWTHEVIQCSKMVITMGCGDNCPVPQGTLTQDWQLPDPYRKDLAEVRPIRDAVMKRVDILVDELHAVPSE